MDAVRAANVSVRGDWCAIGEAPLIVSDPLQLRYLLGLDRTLPSIRARQQHAAGLMPVSYFRAVAQRLSARTLRQVERLLSGANVLFRDEFKNLVVNEGLDDLLDVTLNGGLEFQTPRGGTTQDSTWFVGLMSATPAAAAADTLASHAGWTEVTSYTQINRVAWVDGGVASRSISNTGSVAQFTINATVTVGGSFLAGVNTGTSGRLYAAGAFSGGNKPLANLDTLSVTNTFTTAAA